MKSLFRLILFLLILLSFVFFSKSPALADSPLLCGTCPGGGLPSYSSNNPDGTGCNIAQYQYQATWCSFSGNTCLVPMGVLPTCTGITVGQIPGVSINVGSAYTYGTGSFTDQFAGPYSATVNYGDGTGIQPLTLTGNNFSLNHTYLSVGVYTVTVTVSDSSGGMPASSLAQVNVIRVDPVVGPITVDNSTVAVNTNVTAFAAFTNPGVLDSHTAVWDWGDGTTSVGTVTEANSSGWVTDAHTYTAAGVYTITLTVSNNNGSGTATYQYVSVFDPSGSFLNGSGKFVSPAGALVQNPLVSGDLKFGVEAKYVRNSILPKGKIKLDLKKEHNHLGEEDEFEFEFETTSYQWLVVFGNVAYLQGVGTINDHGNYNVLLTAVDGNQTGTPDLIRIQITDPLTNAVMYDNEPGSPTYALPVTPITKGSIKIHH